MAENLTARFFFVVVVVVVVVLPGFTGFLTDVCRVQVSYFFINFFLGNFSLKLLRRRVRFFFLSRRRGLATFLPFSLFFDFFFFVVCRLSFPPSAAAAAAAAAAADGDAPVDVGRRQRRLRSFNAARVAAIRRRSTKTRRRTRISTPARPPERCGRFRGAGPISGDASGRVQDPSSRALCTVFFFFLSFFLSFLRRSSSRMKTSGRPPIGQVVVVDVVDESLSVLNQQDVRASWTLFTHTHTHRRAPKEKKTNEVVGPHAVPPTRRQNWVAKITKTNKKETDQPQRKGHYQDWEDGR